MNLKKYALLLSLAAVSVSPIFAQDDDNHKGIRLNHVFVIMMENHAYGQIIGNPNAPFINQYSMKANLATNYFGVGHPSLTNYLEVVGASNFGVINDHAPNWHSLAPTGCISNLELNQPSDESDPNSICPIAGSGLDAATPAVDTTNEGSATSPVYNDPYAAQQTQGITIADQLVAAGKSWKSYQENLPPYGADNVNTSDGLISEVTQSEPDKPQLYAVKHNPFAYFDNIQKGTNPELSLKQIVDFHTLYSDLATGHVPNYAFIAPNQCHDQHGRGLKEMGLGCTVDQNQIASGDAALHTLIDAIKASPAWSKGNNVIVTVWDENDYGTEPNQVVTIIDTNYAPTGITSNVKYNHFSLLKTIEAGFGLPYLNHAADPGTAAMSDLFSFKK